MWSLRKADIPLHPAGATPWGAAGSSAEVPWESQTRGIKRKAWEWHLAHRAKCNFITLSPEEPISCSVQAEFRAPEKIQFQSVRWGVSQEKLQIYFYSVTDPSCAAGLAIKLNRTAFLRLSYFCKIQEKASLDNFLIQTFLTMKKILHVHIDFWLLRKYVYELKEQMSQSSARGRSFCHAAFLTHSNNPFHRVCFTIISNPIYQQKVAGSTLLQG